MKLDKMYLEATLETKGRLKSVARQADSLHVLAPYAFFSLVLQNFKFPITQDEAWIGFNTFRKNI